MSRSFKSFIMSLMNMFTNNPKPQTHSTDSPPSLKPDARGVQRAREFARALANAGITTGRGLLTIRTTTGEQAWTRTVGRKVGQAP